MSIMNDKFKTYVGSLLTATSNPETGENPEFGQLAQGSLAPHVEKMRMTATQFAAATGLTVTDVGVINDANPTSSDAILAQSQTLVLMAQQLNTGNGDALRTIARMAQAIARSVTLDELTEEERDVIAHFKNPAMPSVAVTADAAIKIATARQEFASTDTFLEMIGFDQADILRIKAQEQRVRGQKTLLEVENEDNGDGRGASTYTQQLAKLNQKAGQLMADYIAAHGTGDTDALIAYAHALVTKYGEGSAELACQMYDALAAAAKAGVPAAEPAQPASYGEIARMVQATKASPPQMQRGVSRLVKRAGADTTLKNALRDGAEFAWVPQGDTCAFCLTLASRGWQKASQAAIKGGHAEHIHANCDCEYAIRFDGRSTVAGYDPDKYLRQYRAAGSDVNALRRVNYAKNRERINAQKRAAYALRGKPPLHPRRIVLYIEFHRQRWEREEDRADSSW